MCRFIFTELLFKWDRDASKVCYEQPKGVTYTKMECSSVAFVDTLRPRITSSVWNKISRQTVPITWPWKSMCLVIHSRFLNVNVTPASCKIASNLVDHGQYARRVHLKTRQYRPGIPVYTSCLTLREWQPWPVGMFQISFSFQTAF